MKKKFIFIMVSIFLICSILPLTLSNETNIAYAEELKEQVLETKFGYVINDKTLSKVVLFGTYEKDSPFAQKIRIEIKDIETDKTILTIHPTTDYGYSPTILLANFKEGKHQQIFLGMSSGGSGGYGYYYVYNINNCRVKTVFDYEKWDKEYTAKYADDYKVIVNETGTNKKYIIDISLRDNEYLSQIYDSDGKLLEPKDADVSMLNTAFPYYNSAQGIYQLEVLQRITGLYNADSLGYMINYTQYKNNKFTPYFTMLGVL